MRSRARALRERQTSIDRVGALLGAALLGRAPLRVGGGPARGEAPQYDLDSAALRRAADCGGALAKPRLVERLLQIEQIGEALFAEPAASIGHTILVWRLSADDLLAALLGAPAELLPTSALSPGMRAHQARAVRALLGEVLEVAAPSGALLR